MRKAVLAFLILATISPCFGKYSGGSGDPNDPYQISSAADLLALGANTGDYSSHFVLTADIDLDPNLPGGQVFTTAIIAPNWPAFTGTFDGNSHKITNFTINGGDKLGLFGWIGGSVKNLGLENCSVSSDSNSWYVGGLVGENDGGNISNCYSTGTVSGSFNVGGLVGENDGGSISNCYSTGTVSSSSYSYYYYVGGLVGGNAGGSISNCYSTGTVSGSSYSYYVGGLVGWNGGSISNCYSNGTVSGSFNVGGLVGDNVGSISDCYSTGTVSGSSSSYYSYVGGLVGDNVGSISDCYSTGTVSGSSHSSYVGGLAGSSAGGVVSSFWDTQTSGRATSAGGTGKTTAKMKTLTTYTSAGWDFVNETVNGTCNYWQMSADAYPVLSIFNGYIPPEPNGSGTPQNPYIIVDANDLGTIWYRPTANYVLANDINLAGISWSMAVVPVFNGVLDGKGFCVKNLSINGAGYLGLFGSIEGGSVKNLGIKNCTVSGSSWYVGGLVGRNYSGTISNCYSTGMVSSSGYVGGDYVGGLVGENNGGSISNCYSMGTVSGSSYSSYSCYVGGLVGFNEYGSIISNCYSTGTVSGSQFVGGLVGYGDYGNISGCYSTSTVSGSSNVGGLVGENGGSISNCYSTGTVSGSQFVGGLVGYNYGNISNCYSTSDVNGSSDVGGLVGENNGGSISSSYFLITSGPNNGSGTPLTDAQMKQQSSFVGWDFVGETTNGYEDFWRLCNEGLEYPKLAWQYLPGDIVCPDGVDISDLAELCKQWLFEEIPADLAPLGGDGTVDFADFAIFADQWGTTNDINTLLDFARQWLKVGLPHCSADINGDGRVDLKDLAALAGYWLTGL
ncbi:MAG: GLUG motif-containing protein [Sedimentisphaerales bacterium]|jgi:hypothetical protein